MVSTMKTLTAGLAVVLCICFNGCGVSSQRRGRLGAGINIAKEFDCPEEFGYYSHPSDCTMYYVCVFGGALLESCTGGLMYSQELQTCDWPRNVGCTVTEVETATVTTSRVTEPRSRQTTIQSRNKPTISAREQSQRHQQDEIAKHQLYADDVGPAEEAETDRQQRVYRGQPGTITLGQNLDTRHQITNAIPSHNGRIANGDKIGVIAIGTQQHQQQQHQQQQQQHQQQQQQQQQQHQQQNQGQYRVEPTSAPSTYAQELVVSTKAGPLYNGSQQYDLTQYDPYYSLYDEDVELYRDVDYGQFPSNQGNQQSNGNQYRGGENNFRQERPVETVQQPQQPERNRPTSYTQQPTYNNQDVYTQTIRAPVQQEYHENNFNQQAEDQGQYQPIARVPVKATPTRQVTRLRPETADGVSLHRRRTQTLPRIPTTIPTPLSAPVALIKNVTNPIKQVKRVLLKTAVTLRDPSKYSENLRSPFSGQNENLPITVAVAVDNENDPPAKFRQGSSEILTLRNNRGNVRNDNLERSVIDDSFLVAHPETVVPIPVYSRSENQPNLDSNSFFSANLQPVSSKVEPVTNTNQQRPIAGNNFVSTTPKIVVSKRANLRIRNQSKPIVNSFIATNLDLVPKVGDVRVENPPSPITVKSVISNPATLDQPRNEYQSRPIPINSFVATNHKSVRNNEEESIVEYQPRPIIASNSFLVRNPTTIGNHSGNPNVENSATLINHNVNLRSENNLKPTSEMFSANLKPLIPATISLNPVQVQSSKITDSRFVLDSLYVDLSGPNPPPLSLASAPSGTNGKVAPLSLASAPSGTTGKVDIISKYLPRGSSTEAPVNTKAQTEHRVPSLRRSTSRPNVEYIKDYTSESVLVSKIPVSEVLDNSGLVRQKSQMRKAIESRQSHLNVNDGSFSEDPLSINSLSPDSFIDPTEATSPSRARIANRRMPLSPNPLKCSEGKAIGCNEIPQIRVRPTTASPDYQATPSQIRGSVRNRGGASYTTASGDSANRGTPAPITRSRPTLKPSTVIVSKAQEFIDIYRFGEASRPEPVYATPQVDKTAAKCRKDVCLLPDCSCGGKDIPDDLAPETVPQIVLLTFDDSVNDLNKGLYSSLFEKGRLNPNGCPIAATFYVSHEWTNYGQVQNLYADGHEIASHSVSHSFGEQFSQKKWTREIAGQREILAAYGGVRVEDVRGMRAPFLSVGGNKMFKMLYDSNFTYDSSMPVYENKPPSYPYTFDYKIFHDCMIPPCPTRSYPGVWEVPMVMWQDLNGGRCSMGDACSNPPTADGVYKMLIKNFERHYTTNRAPFGLFYHAAWFTQVHHKEGFEAFLDTIVNMPDVWLVTNWQALQWVRDPTPISRINSFQPFQCNYPERPKKCNSPKVCNLWHKSGVRYMKTCQPCPDIYPWTGKSGVRNSRVDNEIIDE